MTARLSMLDRMIDKGSTDPFVHYARAMELRSLGRNADALEAFGAVRERFPAYVPTYLMGGQLAVELGMPDVARVFFEAGLSVARAAGDDHALSEIGSALALLP